MNSKKENINPYYVGVGIGEYNFKKLHPNEGPLLYTQGITFCTGIGFIHKENGQIQSIGLYHSNSEHGSTPDVIRKTIKVIQEYSGNERVINDYCNRNAPVGAQLIRGIYDMISKASDGKLTVIIHDSYHDTLEDGHETNCANIRRVIKAVKKETCSNLNLKFFHHRGQGAFYVTTKGEYCTNRPNEEETLSIRLAQYINDKLYNYLKEKQETKNFRAAHYSITFLNKETLKGNSTDKKIMKLINEGFRNPQKCKECLKKVLAVLEIKIKEKHLGWRLLYDDTEYHHTKKFYGELKVALNVISLNGTDLGLKIAL